jgi:hypothetical protein
METRLKNVIAVLLFAAYSGICPANPTTEQLFDQCKKVEKINSKEASTTGADAVDATACLSYLAGFFQAYNLKNSCDLSKTTTNDLLIDFQAGARKRGMLQEPAWLAVDLVIEQCYCTKPRGFLGDACVTPAR